MTETMQREARFVTDKAGNEYVSIWTDSEVYYWARSSGNSFLLSFTKFPLARMSDAQLNVLHVARAKAEHKAEAKLEAPQTHEYEGIVSMFEKASRTLKHPSFKVEFEESTYELKLAGSASRNAGCLNITDGGKFGMNLWFGVITPQGTFSPSRIGEGNTQVMRFLQAVNENPANVARIHGRKFGHCCFCGIQLDTKESVYAGYGPICAGKYGLPWGKIED